jgi:hypothetical protein
VVGRLFKTVDCIAGAILTASFQLAVKKITDMQTLLLFLWPPRPHQLVLLTEPTDIDATNAANSKIQNIFFSLLCTV